MQIELEVGRKKLQIQTRQEGYGRDINVIQLHEYYWISYRPVVIVGD
jgi:hypothetical protein